jgi:hypothetical protein
MGDRFSNACATAGDENSLARLVQRRLGGRDSRVRCPVDGGREVSGDAVVGHGHRRAVKEFREKLLLWDGTVVCKIEC